MMRIILMVVKSLFQLPNWTVQINKYKDTTKYDVISRYNYTRILVKKIIKKGRVKVLSYGNSNLPKDNGYVLYPNHQGLFDPLAIIHTHDNPVSAVSKIENKNLIFVSDVFELLDSRYIDRDDVRSSLKIFVDVAKEVAGGKNYMIFPEGTRSKKGNEIGEFKGGSFKASMIGKRPIVPVAIIDSYRVFDIKSIKKQTVQIHYLKPLYYEDYKDMKSLEIAAYVSNEIKKTISEYDK